VSFQPQKFLVAPGDSQALIVPAHKRGRFPSKIE
jgi:hypothetical protein